MEIFSEHGCSESITAPIGDFIRHSFIRHSMGGRVTENTVDRQLERGLRFGFVASTDDHLGSAAVAAAGNTLAPAHSAAVFKKWRRLLVAKCG